MTNKVNIDGVYRDITRGYCSVDGIVKELYLGYCNIDGINKLCYTSTGPNKYVIMQYYNGNPVYSYQLLDDGNTLKAFLTGKPSVPLPAGGTDVGWEFTNLTVGDTVTIDWEGTQVGSYGGNDFNVVDNNIAKLTHGMSFTRRTESFRLETNKFVIVCHSHVTDTRLVDINYTVYRVIVGNKQLYPRV